MRDNCVAAPAKIKMHIDTQPYQYRVVRIRCSPLEIRLREHVNVRIHGAAKLATGANPIGHSTCDQLLVIVE
jgi:hypothetical protein